MNYDQALKWLSYRIACVPAEARLRDDGRQYVAALRSIRDLLYAGRENARVVDQLARLCLCDVNPETTDGPEQECPIHGDGATFVALCRWQQATIAAATKVRDTPSDKLGALDRVFDLLDSGPWGAPAAQVTGPAADLETEGRDPYGSVNSDEPGPDWDRSGATP